MFGEIDWFWLILTLILSISRIRYVWQGTKIRRRKSSRDISRKNILIAVLIYYLLLVKDFSHGDIYDIIFRGIGSFTCTFCLLMTYWYWNKGESLPNPITWVREAFTEEEEGGIWR